MKSSLFFVALAFVLLFVADLEVLTLHPWQELQRMLMGAVTPDLMVVYDIREAFLNTVVFAFCGIFLSMLMGSILAFFFEWRPVRLFCAFIRAIHEIFWALIFLPVVGLNPLCGVLAIALPYTGIFAKVYAEIRQESDHSPLAGIPFQTRSIDQFLYGVLPVIYADIKHYSSYRLECALRSSAILGFIGLPTLGFHLETAFREGLYSEVFAILYCFYFLIASLHYWVREKVSWIYIVLAFAFISKEVSLSWSNVTRFFTYEILPWPMRREGVLDGTLDVSFYWDQVWRWGVDILWTEGFSGVWNTIVLTQIVLAGTGIMALLVFPLVCRHFQSNFPRRISRYTLIVIRTTPEYILAYAFLQLWGPSMLPAIVAICLHNGAILGHLTGENAELIKLQADGPKGNINRYFFEVLPRVYGQFLAFLFYRWEAIMRESAILGILGIYTLGFYIDSAISDDKMDKAVFLILITALLNMIIDTVSQRIRKRWKVSALMISPGSH